MNISKYLRIIAQPTNNLDAYDIIKIRENPKHRGTFKIHIRSGFY